MLIKSLLILSLITLLGNIVQGSVIPTLVEVLSYFNTNFLYILNLQKLL